MENQDEILKNIKESKQRRLDVIGGTTGNTDTSRFDVTKENQRVVKKEQEKEYQETTTFGERVKESAAGGLENSLFDTVIDDVALRAAAVSEEDTVTGGIKAALFPFEDKTYNRRDPEVHSEILKEIESLGLDPESAEARSLGTAKSEKERMIRFAEIKGNIDRLKNISRSGVVSGAIPYFMGSMVDADIFIGGGFYSKAKAAAQLKVGAELDAAIKYQRLNNISDGAVAGFKAGVLTEGGKVVLDPDVDGSDLLGTIAMTTILGGGIGGVLPAKRAEDFLVSRERAKAYTDIKDKVRKDPEANSFKRSMDFVFKAEGGFANVKGDAGGATMMGISKANFPNQFNEIQKIYKSKGERAAKNYAESFYNGTFYKKVVTPGMDSNTSMVMMDTAVLMGTGRAKQFYKQSGGDLNKFLDLRQEYHNKRAGKDVNGVSQSKFIKGWTNRVNDLRKEISSGPKSRVSTGKGVTPESDTVTPTKEADRGPEDTLNDNLGTNTPKDKTDVVEEPTQAVDEEAIIQAEMDAVSKIKLVLDKENSVGAARIKDVNAPDVDIGNKSKELLDLIEEKMYEDDVLEEIDNFTSFNKLDTIDSPDGVSPEGRFVDDEFAPLPIKALRAAGEKFYAATNKAGLSPDYDRGMTSNNKALQFLTYKLLNSPLGQIANSNNADNLATGIHDTVTSKYSPFYADNFHDWAKDQGYDFKQRWVYTEAEKEFNRKVVDVLDNRANNIVDKQPHVALDKAADEVEDAYKTLLDYQKKNGVEGFEDVEYKIGHNKTVWDKDSWSSIERMRGVGTKAIVQTIKKAIMKASPDVSEFDAFIWATAIKRNATDFKASNPSSSLMNMGEDGREAIEDALRQNPNIPENEITKRADAILYTTDEKGTVKASRKRINMDYTVRIPNTDKTIRDLTDTNVFNTLDRHVRAQSGEIGRVAATDGLLQKRNIPSFIQAVEDQARLNGTDPAKQLQLAEDILSQFNEGAFGGGINKWTSRLNRGSRLSFLAQLGVTQIAETGIMMAKSNVKGLEKVLGDEIKSYVSKLPNDTLNDLVSGGRYRRPDELQGRALNLDEVAYEDASSFEKILDESIDKGTKAMGHISGFYHITGLQQRMSTQINMRNILDGITNNTLSTKRLNALNVDRAFRDKLKVYAKDVIRDEDGIITDIQSSKWDPDDLDTFRNVIRQNVDYDVQLTRRGQGHSFVNRNDFASILSNLKTFAMNAMFSKSLRNARIADRQAAAEMTWNLGWSALAVTASAAVNGKLDKLDSDTLSRRTLAWSAHISPLMMVTDPILWLSGVDYYGDDDKRSALQRYRYSGDGLLSMPAPLAAAGQLAGVLRVGGNVIGGDSPGLDRSTINSIKAIPVIGRMYGVPWALDEFNNNLKGKD